MPHDWIIYACLITGVSSGLVAGVFQSFSDFIMRSLAAARPAAGIESMQMINREVFRTMFMVLAWGTIPLSLALAIYAYIYLSSPASLLTVTGATIYFVVVFLVTMLGNVPMNQQLDGMDPFAEETTQYWKTYTVVWTRWNHVRTLGSLATALCFLMASIALA